MADLERQVMLELFEQKSPNTMFLSNFFRRDPMWIVDTNEVEMDVIRDNEKISIDVTPFTAGRLNVKKRWTTKKYKPPMHDEYHSYEGKEFLDRLPGVNPYAPANNVAALLGKITDDQASLQKKINRSIEKMASDVFFSGKIVTLSDEEIDFKMKSSHQIDAAAAWGGGSATIPVDLKNLADILRKDGKITMTDLVFGSSAWENFLKETTQANRFNFRRVEVTDISMPSMLDANNGAAFHGIIAVESYQVRCWTYPQFYDVPTDEEVGVDSGTITNAGQTGVAYVPENLVLGIGVGIDLRLVFGGIPHIINRPDPRLEALGIDGIPYAMARDFHPYALLDKKENALLVGVKSRPLTIPAQIDGFGFIDTQP